MSGWASPHWLKGGCDVEMPPRTCTGINRNVEQGWIQSLQF